MMQRINFFYTLLLLVLPIAYVHGNYEYIKLDYCNFSKKHYLFLQSKIKFSDQDSEHNQKIISEIIRALNEFELKDISLVGSEVDLNIINLFTNELKISLSKKVI